MNIVGLIYLAFSHPVWFWHVVWHRILNPANLSNRHIRRPQEYKLRELPLRKAVQKVTCSDNEETDSILDESLEVRLGESSVNQSIPQRFDASVKLAHLCYSIELSRPVVVETGLLRCHHSLDT
jgi:hypothetical protein